MDLTLIRSLLAVSDHGAIGEASHALGLSQNKPEISWLHCVGATGEDMCWTGRNS